MTLPLVASVAVIAFVTVPAITNAASTVQLACFAAHAKSPDSPTVTIATPTTIEPINQPASSYLLTPFYFVALMDKCLRYALGGLLAEQFL